MIQILTIGHSDTPLARFLELLRMYEVQAVVDVRSYPTSTHAPQFALPGLARALRAAGLTYVFLGRQLGGRPRARDLYDERGRVQYARLAATPAFARGIDSLMAVASRYRTALLCAEENPLVCHRRVLIGVALAEHGVELVHIRGDGALQADADLEMARDKRVRRLLDAFDSERCTCDALTLYTIGFAGRTAESFFGTLRERGVQQVIDVRLSNNGQLAGFTKRQDLPYFLQKLCQAEYKHELSFAPTETILKEYRATRDWSTYERTFRSLLREREAARLVTVGQLTKPTALLCSEPASDRCHRRLVAEHLRDQLGDLYIVHL